MTIRTKNLPLKSAQSIRRLVVALLSVSLVFGPVFKAFAFVPAVPVIYVGATAYTWSVAQIAALIAAGAAITSILVGDSGSSDGLKVHINPKSPQTVPSGWSAASPASSQPVPPSTSSPNVTYSCATNGNGTTVAASPTAACAGTIAWANTADAPNFVYSMGSCTGGTCVIHKMSPTFICSGGSNTTCADVAYTYSTSSTCATGYTASGGSCNLSNAAIVVKPSDTFNEWMITGGTFAQVPNDPDTAKAVPTVATGTQISVKNGATTTTVKIEGDGTMTMTKTTPNGNGTSTRETLKTSIPDSGAANGGTVASSIKTEQVVGEGTTSDTDSAVSDTVTCTNCATEATQQQVKTAIEEINTNGVKIKEQGSTWSTERTQIGTDQAAAAAVLTAIKAKGDAAAASGLGTDLNSALGNVPIATTAPSAAFWSTWFPAPATCTSTALGGTGRFTGLSMDLCPVLNGLRPVLEWGLWLLTALVLYQSWFGGRTPTLNYRAGS